MCYYDDYGECDVENCDDNDCWYGCTCPIFDDMMCLGKGKCEHNSACEHIYYKVRFDETLRAKEILRLSNRLKE